MEKDRKKWFYYSIYSLHFARTGRRCTSLVPVSQTECIDFNKMEFNFVCCIYTNTRIDKRFGVTWKWHKMVFNMARRAVLLISYVKLFGTCEHKICAGRSRRSMRWNSILMVRSLSPVHSFVRLLCFKMHNTLQYPLFSQWVSFYDAPCYFSGVHKLPRIHPIIRADNSANKMHKHFNAPSEQ